MPPKPELDDEIIRGLQTVGGAGGNAASADAATHGGELVEALKRDSQFLKTLKEQLSAGKYKDRARRAYRNEDIDQLMDHLRHNPARSSELQSVADDDQDYQDVVQALMLASQLTSTQDPEKIDAIKSALQGLQPHSQVARNVISSAITQADSMHNAAATASSLKNAAAALLAGVAGIGTTIGDWLDPSGATQFLNELQDVALKKDFKLIINPSQSALFGGSAQSEGDPATEMKTAIANLLGYRNSLSTTDVNEKARNNELQAEAITLIDALVAQRGHGGKKDVEAAQDALKKFLKVKLVGAITGKSSATVSSGTDVHSIDPSIATTETSAKRTQDTNAPLATL